MTDPYSQRNSTFFLYSPEFAAMREFAETRDLIKSEIVVTYLADCEAMTDTKTLYLVLWIVCLCMVVTLTIYNQARFRHGVEGTVNDVHVAMQVKLIGLLFLLALKAYLNW